MKRIAAGGFNFGYFYADSPIIAYDGAPQPSFTMNEFTQERHEDIS